MNDETILTKDPLEEPPTHFHAPTALDFLIPTINSFRAIASPKEYNKVS